MAQDLERFLEGEPILARARRVRLPAGAPSSYRLRESPTDVHLSTLEAVARARRPQGLQPLHRYWQCHAHLGSDGLELYVLKQLELQRIVSRVAPLLGLVATMIPMGPALVAVAAGNTQGMAQNLVVAFAAVIVALLAAAITFVVQTLRKRWLMEELNVLLIGLDAAPVAVPTPAHGHAHDAVPSRATRELAHG
ncbi:MAG TPA: MotA/TolQ/ExbB proton channel family protein [Giesbergeria sp.]|nr:MotA/TolQ/ExbB proton channel family protein [Giesbergeria sp.]